MSNKKRLRRRSVPRRGAGPRHPSVPALFFTLLILCSAVSLTARGAVSGSGRDSLRVATVAEITDADSYILVLDGRKERVRLIGIDAPEASANRRAYQQARRGGRDVEDVVRQGREAARVVRSMLQPGDTVRVELDVQERDRYGRLLVYLYLADGRMLNRLLLTQGVARLLTVPPNVRHVEEFRSAVREAESSGPTR